jgi:predicted CoA-binding protein
MTKQRAHHILKNAKTIAIVGISNKPERDSYKVAVYLQEQGYQIIAINPVLAGTTVLNTFCYESLKKAKEKMSVEIDIVDCFRKSEDIFPIVEEAILVNAKCIWMQLGIVNHEAESLAKQKGLQVVMDLCTKIEHKKMIESNARNIL